MAQYSLYRDNILQKSLEKILLFRFDGIEIHWLNPADTGKGGRCEDKENFVKLIKVRFKLP